VKDSLNGIGLFGHIKLGLSTDELVSHNLGPPFCDHFVQIHCLPSKLNWGRLPLRFDFALLVVCGRSLVQLWQPPKFTFSKPALSTQCSGLGFGRDRHAGSLHACTPAY
jgi:hypothetical protein